MTKVSVEMEDLKAFLHYLADRVHEVYRHEVYQHEVHRSIDNFLLELEQERERGDDANADHKS